MRDSTVNGGDDNVCIKVLNARPTGVYWQHVTWPHAVNTPIGHVNCASLFPLFSPRARTSLSQERVPVCYVSLARSLALSRSRSRALSLTYPPPAPFPYL